MKCYKSEMPTKKYAAGGAASGSVPKTAKEVVSEQKVRPAVKAKPLQVMLDGKSTSNKTLAGASFKKGGKCK